MTKMQTILIIILGVVTNSATVLADSPTPGPTSTPTPVQLECNSVGTLTLTNKPGWVNSATAECNNVTNDALVDTTSNTIVITGCKVGTQVTLNMYSAASSPTLGSVNTNQMSKFVLTCISAAGGVKKATLDLSESVAQQTVTAKETVLLSMSLTIQGQTNPLHNVEIGKHYDLHITGAGSHFMKIINCTAKGSRTATAVVIYDSTKTGNDPGVMSSPQTESASEIDLHPLKISMTGFRLVGSSTVYLECDVQLCNNEHSCPLGRKRKRTKVNIKRAGIQFEVIGAQDRTPASGAKEIHAEWKFTLTFVIAVMTGHLMLR